MSLSSVSEHDKFLQKIESIPNLRLLCTRSDQNLDTFSTHNGAIYRSSKPDRITADDVVHFKKLGIKTIVDFRSLDEYRSSDGLCFLDKEYSIYKVLLPKKEYKSGDEVESELIAKCDVPTPGIEEKKHFLINFFTASYVLTAMKRVPWYLMIIGMFHAMYDFFKKNKFKTFINFFIKHSVNKGGIVGQYKDIVDVSGSAVCAALKLVSKPENMPVLINCAHGKDRTGIMSALILICLGMSEDYVKTEYSLSERGLESIQHLIHKEMIEKLKLKHCFCTANAETMSELLSYINEKHESVQQYMCHIGFDLEDQQRLRDNLIAFENQECVRMKLSRDGDGLQNGTDVDVKDVHLN